MTINRTTNTMLSARSVGYLQDNLGRLGKLQATVASGKNIVRPSDDPVGLSRILALSNALKTDTRYKQNTDAARAELKTVDTTLMGVKNLIQRAQEIATQGASSIYSQDQRNTLAQEVSNLMDTLVQQGNTKLGDKYLFSGFKTDTPAFSRSGDTVTFAGTNPAESSNRNVDIADGISLTMNLNGQSLFGTSSTGTPPTGSGLFATLAKLRYALVNADVTTVRAQMDTLDNDLNTITVNHANVGALLNRLDDTDARSEQRGATLSEQMAQIQEVDMPKILSDLQYQEKVMQGSLAVAGRVLQTSLLDFLR
jgi:flagellar hook-associated protein 3 FlgL